MCVCMCVCVCVCVCVCGTSLPLSSLKVYVHDPHSMEVVASFTAHTSGMSDMDVVGCYLVTCGLTHQ